MPLTRTSLIRIIRLSIVIILVGLIVAYAIWRSFNYARGPYIDIFEPIDGASLSADTITLKGKALRVISLNLNGRTIFVDQEGNWSETMAVFPGQNSFVITASDRFGRSISKRLEIVGAFEEPVVEIQ